MATNEEVQDILSKLWTKLQGLPEANSLDLGAFLVIILFIVTVLAMVALTCAQFCSCTQSKYQASRVQPL